MKEILKENKSCFFVIELPKYDSAIVYNDHERNILKTATTGFFLDPELDRENIIEEKHRKIVRSHRSGPLDREMKPDSHTRDELQVSYYLIKRKY